MTKDNYPWKVAFNFIIDSVLFLTVIVFFGKVCWLIVNRSNDENSVVVFSTLLVLIPLIIEKRDKEIYQSGFHGGVMSGEVTVRTLVPFIYVRKLALKLSFWLMFLGTGLACYSALVL